MSRRGKRVFIVGTMFLILFAGIVATLVWPHQKAPETTNRDDVDANLQSAAGALAEGRAADAEDLLKSVLAAEPENLAANNQLAYLLGVEGRRFEATEFLIRVVRHGDAKVDHLVLLGAVEPVISDQAFVARCRKAVPDDPLPLLGTARTAITRHDFATAEPILRSIIRSRPEQLDAQAELGTILFETGSDEFLHWHAKLPAAANHHPEIWAIRGFWAEKNREPLVAVRCFWEAVRLDAEHRAANYQLGQLLEANGDPAQATLFRERAARLQKLSVLFDGLYENPTDVARMRDVTTLLQSLGRYWEAWAWSRIAVSTDPDADWAWQILKRLDGRLPSVNSRTTDVADNPAFQVDLSGYPLPDWAPPVSDAPPLAAPQTASISFSDDAAAAGLSFVFYNGQDPQSNVRRLVETIGGGGVAVLDFDRDGWADLYFTQGTSWPLDPQRTECRNRLFRNQGGRRFEDVTEEAGVGDNGFGQGATVGDFNNDGWPDLYVANIGRNRLYVNNGDGTFADASDEIESAGERWTASCLLADLNGDGLPDLYDVNYLSLATAPGAPCPPGTEQQTCSPAAFPSEQDQVFLNLGDGRFREVSDSAGVVRGGGKGLGIVAADFDGSGRLSLFIANDGVPNFFFANETARRGGELLFAERGLVSGLALDADGLVQGCMGVASGDVNGDGRLDLFVTNFSDQSNTLYLGQPGNLFVDATREANLRAASYALLGFGTQMLDADLDGRPDLVIANGHIYDDFEPGTEYQMRPQFFQNLDGQTFRELAAETLGNYFQRRYLGRGLALVDWNRDGRQDFVVSQMSGPASLVTNRTQQLGNYLIVNLVGTVSARDAIGTIVTARAGSQTWTQQLTAGDGYAASNQRQLIFGLGPHEHLDEVIVRWPSQRVQKFPGQPAGTEVVLIEGASAYLLPR